MQAQNDAKFRILGSGFPGQVPAGELEVTVVDERVCRPVSIRHILRCRAPHRRTPPTKSYSAKMRPGCPPARDR